MRLCKKGMGISLGSLAPLFVILVITTIILTIGATILDDMRQDDCPVNCTFHINETAGEYECKLWNGSVWLVCPNSYGYVYNVTVEGYESSLEVGNWLPTMGLLLGAGTVIGAVYLITRN